MTVVRLASTAECLEYGSPRLAEVIPIEAGFSRRPGVRHNRRNIGAFVAAASGSSDYSPLDEGNCVAWFDMQDTGAYTTDAGAVSSVTNKASSVAWTEATVRPAFSATGLNGFPAMQFDGINDRITSTEAAVFGVFAGGGVAYTLFGVPQHDVADSAHRWFGVANSGTANGHRTWGTTITGDGVWISAATSDAGAAANAASSGGSDTSPHVLCWSSSTTEASLFVDDGAADPSAASQAPGTITPNNAALGGRPSSSPGVLFDGFLGEVILYSVQLSTEARERVRDYLLNKWGL